MDDTTWAASITSNLYRLTKNSTSITSKTFLNNNSPHAARTLPNGYAYFSSGTITYVMNLNSYFNNGSYKTLDRNTYEGNAQSKYLPSDVDVYDITTNSHIEMEGNIIGSTARIVIDNVIFFIKSSNSSSANDAISLMGTYGKVLT